MSSKATLRILILSLIFSVSIFGQNMPASTNGFIPNWTEYVAGGGTAQAQTVTMSPAVSALTTGLTIRWKPTAANTGAAPTLAVNGLTATAITKCGATALVANDLNTNTVAVATYDGTQFQLLNPQVNICGNLSVPPGIDLTGQTAALSGTSLSASVPATGQYLITLYTKITTVASTSSILGGSSGMKI